MLRLFVQLVSKMANSYNVKNLLMLVRQYLYSKTLNIRYPQKKEITERSMANSLNIIKCLKCIK